MIGIFRQEQYQYHTVFLPPVYNSHRKLTLNSLYG